MANKKAFDYQYIKCVREAIDETLSWYRNNKLGIDPQSIKIVWFGYTKKGYRCMTTSTMYQNNFFEIIKNMKTGEMICMVLQQTECIVHPSQDEVLYLHDPCHIIDNLV